MAKGTIMDKNQFIETMEAHLQRFDREIQELAGRAEKAGAGLKADLETQMNDLRAKREQARKRLAILREKGEGAWEELRDGMETAWRDLRQSMERATEKFR